MPNPLTNPTHGEPGEIVKGDKAAWRRDDLVSDYPSIDGWALSYRVVWLGGVTVTVALTADGSGWKALADAATWTVGQADWFLQATHATLGKTTVARGTFTVLPDPAAAGAGYDPRSHARKVLDAVEAAIEGRASKTDMETTLADGRSIRRLSHKELLDMRDSYAAKVRAEERRQAGRGPGRVLARM